MTQLKCTTCNCIHNLKCHCNAGVVSIDERGLCDSKMKRAGGALEQTFAEIESAAEFIPDAPLAIDCKCDCIYNDNSKCCAHSVYVSDALIRTKCATRIKK